MKALILIAIALALISCSKPSPIGETKTVGMVEVEGVECVIYERKVGYSGMGGISCNWEAYNAGR